ncbi:MAG: AAA family ATPase [Candidatus Micrarchaeota archaeon]|nr:AAA family ATPase [Candidatus Micrarchaeota archaeon]
MDTEIKTRRRYFYHTQAIEEHTLIAKFNDYVYTAIREVNDGSFKLHEIINSDGVVQLVIPEQVIALIDLPRPKERERIFRLCRLFGHLKNELSDEDKKEMLSSSDVLGFRYGNGEIAAFFKKRQLYTKAMAYVDGIIPNMDGVTNRKPRKMVKPKRRIKETSQIKKTTRKIHILEPKSKCFYFMPAIKERDWTADFEKFAYTVIARFQEKGNDAPFNYALQGSEGRLHVPVEHVLPTDSLTEKDKERILRLCRLIGYLEEKHPNGSAINYGAEDILGFKHGRGRIVAFLKEQNTELYEQAKKYVNGNIPSLHEVKVDGEAARKHKPSKLSDTGELPKLITLEDVRSFATTTLENTRKLIYGQDDAVRLIIVRIISYLKTGIGEPLLIAGPTGVGKTHSVRTISEIMSIPFGLITIPELTPAGYVGANVENAIAREIRNLKKRHNDPKRIILHIDEFDKIVRKGPEFAPMLQDQLLKLLEPGSELTVGTRFEQIEKIDMNVMMVLSGAFSFIKYDHTSGLDEEQLREASFSEEMIGRIGNPIILRAFDNADFRSLLTANPPLEVLTRSTADLTSYGITVTLEPEAIELFANAAIESKKGARKLSADIRTVMDTLKDRLFFDKDINKIDGLTIEDITEGKRVFRIKREFVEKHVKQKVEKRKVGFRK